MPTQPNHSGVLFSFLRQHFPNSHQCNLSTLTPNLQHHTQTLFIFIWIQKISFTKNNKKPPNPTLPIDTHTSHNSPNPIPFGPSYSTIKSAQTNYSSQPFHSQPSSRPSKTCYTPSNSTHGFSHSNPNLKI